MVRPMLSDRCPVLSVHLCITLVHYDGQTVGWIKVPLGTDVGLNPGDFVLDGDPDPPSQKGGGAQIFGPCLLWPNGCMDQDETWRGGRYAELVMEVCLSHGHIVLDGDPALPLPKGHNSSIFCPFLL